VLATIPFEVLLTNKASRDEKFSELPYLLRKYNISYSYSATLFNRTFPKDKKQKPELTSLNDWLAFAPVFSDENTSGVTIASRELLRRMKNLSNDTTATRGMLYSTGTYITPLPGTENEVKTILTKFDQKKLNAKIELNNNATEELLKSDEIKKYKMLHFATHGFVNSEKPELSGLLLAQIPDTTITETDAELNTGKEQNDGILYSGEIYNLELNADLVVLSACETGLGKIKKGEGIIGLTRALLYAGAKNIVVSLWQVSDESTSQLMINFYNNILENGLKNPNYSNSLQKAKLKMISEGKYAHPFFWSPFILIGK
jgi:CHAT domain-containing protein